MKSLVMAFVDFQKAYEVKFVCFFYLKPNKLTIVYRYVKIVKKEGNKCVCLNKKEYF